MNPITRQNRWRSFYWIGIPLAFILFIGTLILSNQLKRAEFNQFKEQLKEAIDIATNPLENSLETIYEIFVRMSNRWRLLEVNSENFWYQDAETLYKDIGVFRAIQRVDQQMKIKWIIPKRYENWIGFDFSTLPTRKKVLIQAQEKKQPVISTVFSLLQGGKGFWFAVPLYSDNQFDGYVVASIAVDALFSQVFKRGMGEKYGIAVYQGNQHLYSIGGKIENPELVASKKIRVQDTEWTIYMWPTTKLLHELSTILPIVILIAGTIISLLTLIAFYFFEKADVNSYKMRLAKQEAELLSNRLQKILTTVNEGFFSFDQEGNIVDWNPYATKIFGWNKAQIMGKNVFETIISEKDRSRFQSHINEYLQKKDLNILGGEIEFETKKFDGTPLPIEVVMLPLETDHMTTIYVFARDITTRKKAELDQARLSSIIDASEDAIVSADLQGRVVTWNKGAEALYGYSANEIVGKLISTIYTEADKKLLPDILNRIKMGNHIKNTDTVRVDKNGNHIPVSIVVTPMRNQLGKIIGASSIARDISELKKMEKLKNEFVSTVSHELRTPLTSIRGSLGLLSSGKICEINESANNLLEIANKNCDRLIRLINDILDIEKIEAGKMSFNFKAVNLNILIRETILSNQAFAHKTNVNLKFSADEEIYVTGDSDRLIQVITNLLANAIRFSPPSGTVEVKLMASNEKVRVAVIDEGEGVPDLFKDKIFTKFTQADSSSTRKQTGTGLGLSISKAIVEKHGGTIGFESEKHKKTIFYFELPRLNKTGKDKQEVPVEIDRRVLICDANFDSADYIRNLLFTKNINSDIATSAREALELLKHKKYIAITLDLMLPDQDGISLIRHLRKSTLTKDVPIIVVSVNAQEGQHKLNGYGIPIVEWIDKPLDPEKSDRILAYITTKFRHITPNILTIEDDEDVAKLLNLLLQDKAKMTNVGTIESAKNILAKNEFDLIILDLNLPDGLGTQLLPCINYKTKEPIPIIVFSVDELDQKYAHLVKNALLKSRATNEELYRAIATAIDLGS